MTNAEIIWNQAWRYACNSETLTINHALIAWALGYEPWEVTQAIEDHAGMWSTHPLITDGWGTPVATGEGLTEVGWTPGIKINRRRNR